MESQEASKRVKNARVREGRAKGDLSWAYGMLVGLERGDLRDALAASFPLDVLRLAAVSLRDGSLRASPYVFPCRLARPL